MYSITPYLFSVSNLSDLHKTKNHTIGKNNSRGTKIPFVENRRLLFKRFRLENIVIFQGNRNSLKKISLRYKLLS